MDNQRAHQWQNIFASFHPFAGDKNRTLIVDIGFADTVRSDGSRHKQSLNLLDSGFAGAKNPFFDWRETFYTDI
jgi:hypothetical protein